MGLFDFSKKKDEEIESLKKEVESLKTKNFSLVKEYEEKYLPILKEYQKLGDIELSYRKKIYDFESLIESKRDEVKNINIEHDELFKSILNLKEEKKQLQDLIDINSKSPLEYGIYEPVFNYETSEDYKNQIKLNNEKQKAAIEKNIAISNTEDLVFYYNRYEHLKALYKKAISKYKKILALAFNSECDALISKVSWNNVNIYESKITNFYYRLNQNSREFCSFLIMQNLIVNEKLTPVRIDNLEKIQQSHVIKIAKELLDLKIEELKLTHEYRLKRQEEKDEERRIRDLIREEQKAQKDFEKVIKESEKKEVLIRKKIDKLNEQNKLNSTNKLLVRIKELEIELELAKNSKERAISMAQQTKCGFVYVISNIGSFGDDIIKIGMTRRLEPRDRIRELSNASVPFQFDIHTLIYSENAPQLEYDLHNYFKDYRINLVNNRKEFFKVNIKEVEKKLLEIGVSNIFITEPEAVQYRESIKIFEEYQKAKTKLLE